MTSSHLPKRKCEAVFNAWIVYSLEGNHMGLTAVACVVAEKRPQGVCGHYLGVMLSLQHPKEES